jgi:NTE family protein
MTQKYPHRALVLQGGGALGAYEAGVVKALAERLTEEDIQNGRADRPLFDIVAGASIGAVNATILVNHVLNRLRENPKPRISECWTTAVGTLEDFWRTKISNYTLLDTPWSKSSLILWWGFWQSIGEWWNGFWKILFEQPALSWLNEFRRMPPFSGAYFLWPDNYGQLASGEAVRRYYSYLLTTSMGTPGVLRQGMPQPGNMKFLNPFAPIFWRFDNSPLTETLKSYYWINNDNRRSSIQTKEGEPRLLLVAVDVQDCTTAVTFDSYPKIDGEHYSEYGSKPPRVIKYDGVTTNHLLASMSTNQRYEYPYEYTVERERRYFWDGAYLSNTPLRELLQYHRDYWSKVREEEDVPDLEVYIVNLYPAIEESLPRDPDSIQDREIDIKFHDRTAYDLKIAEMTTDYIDLVKNLCDITGDRELLEKLSEDAKKLLNDKVKAIMDKPVTSRKRSGEIRTNEDLVYGRFAVTRAVYVDRIDDKDTILGKAFDFSYSTISDLLQKGYDEGNKAYYQAIEDELERILVGIRYPASKRQILDHALQNKKDLYDVERVLNLLGRLPETRQYSSANDVARAVLVAWAMDKTNTHRISLARSF